MAVMLPLELEIAFGMLGVPWPTQNEDGLRQYAAPYRACAATLTSQVIPIAHGAVRHAAANNAGDGMSMVRTFWAHYHDDDSDGSTHLLSLATLLNALAYGHELAADLVEAYKEFLITVAAVVAVLLAAVLVTGGAAAMQVRMSIVKLRIVVRRAAALIHHELEKFFGRTLVRGIALRLRRILGARSPRVNVASWNIAGGRPINSLDHFDYGPEDVPLFARQLDRNRRPDLVFLQESHVRETPQDSLASRLAGELDMRHVFDTSTSPSHIDPNYNLANSIISESPLRATAAHRLPRPDFPLRIRGEGDPVEPYDRYLQVAEVRVNGRKFTIANIHTNPMEFLGHPGGYMQGDGVRHARDIERFLLDKLPKRGNLLLVGDFNTDDISKAYPELVRKLGLKDALAEVPATVPWGQHPDHILYSHRTLKLIEAAAPADGSTDHYRCVASFSHRPWWQRVLRPET